MGILIFGWTKVAFSIFQTLITVAMDSSGPFLDNSNFGNFDQDSSRRLKHPVVTFFHLIFKSLALIGEETKELYF